VVGRYGGEEFCVLLQDGAEQEASLFARRVVGEARKQTVRLVDGRTATYTFSAGYAGYAARSGSMRPDGTKESIAEVIERADRALYQAKGAGRNQAVAAQSPLAAA
jgi:diguanylate cyclase (GGDEF)-like protein